MILCLRHSDIFISWKWYWNLRFQCYYIRQKTGRSPISLGFSRISLRSNISPTRKGGFSWKKTLSCDKVFFLVGDGGYSAPLDFSTAPSGCEKSAVLETSQSRNAIVRFGLLRLNHLRRFSSNQLFLAKQKRHPEGVFFVWWEMVDSNHRRRSQQIYSLSPLATREISHIKFFYTANHIL